MVGVLQCLLNRIAQPRLRIWIFVCALVSICNQPCFRVIKTPGLLCQEVGQIIMHIDLIQARRIDAVLWIVPNITELINPTTQPNRVLRNEPSHLRIIPARAIVLEASYRITLTTRVTVTRLDAARSVAIGVV